MALSDHVVVMNRGLIIQEGTPAQIYERPSTRFVAEFVGHSNILVGRPRVLDSERYIIDFDDYSIVVQNNGLSNRSQVAVCVRPENFMLASAKTGAGGLEGRVKDKAYLGNLFLYRVALRNAEVQVQLDPASDAHCEEGERVFLTIREDRVHILSE